MYAVRPVVPCRTICTLLQGPGVVKWTGLGFVPHPSPLPLNNPLGPEATYSATARRLRRLTVALYHLLRRSFDLRKRLRRRSTKTARRAQFRASRRARTYSNVVAKAYTRATRAARGPR